MRGSWQSKYGRAPGEVAPDVRAPDAPEWIGDVAREEWDRIVPELLALGLLARIDRATLTGYCVAWETYTRLYQDVRDHGDTYSTEKGIRVRPEVKLLAEAAMNLIRFGRQFGLSPSSRAGLVTNERGPREGAPDLGRFAVER